MTSTSVPQSTLVPGPSATTSDPVRQALVDALIGAVLDELGDVGVARTTPGATKTAPKAKDLRCERLGMR